MSRLLVLPTVNETRTIRVLLVITCIIFYCFETFFVCDLVWTKATILTLTSLMCVGLKHFSESPSWSYMVTLTPAQSPHIYGCGDVSQRLPISPFVQNKLSKDNTGPVHTSTDIHQINTGKTLLSHQKSITSQIQTTNAQKINVHSITHVRTRGRFELSYFILKKKICFYCWLIFISMYAHA